MGVEPGFPGLCSSTPIFEGPDSNSSLKSRTCQLGELACLGEPTNSVERALGGIFSKNSNFHPKLPPLSTNYPYEARPTNRYTVCDITAYGASIRYQAWRSSGN